MPASCSVCPQSDELDVLRLTQTQRAPREVILKAEGQLVAEWVTLLEGECLKLLASDGRVLLDLAELSYADRRGVRMLRELPRGSLAIINCTPLVKELLNEDAV